MCKQPRPALTECSRFCPLFLNNSKRKGPPPDSENLGWLEIDRPHRRRGLMKRPWNVFAAMLCANNRALSWQIVAVSVRFHRNHSKRTSSHLMAGACSFGWAGWNRTSTGRVKVCCPTTRLHPNMGNGTYLLTAYVPLLWGGRWDSNPRSPVPQTGALTN